MRFDCCERQLAGLLSRLGLVVTRWPGPFLLLPPLITAVLMLGVARRAPLLKDDLSLYTPTNAPALVELKSLAHSFPITDTDPFYAERRFDAKRAGYIIVTGKPEGEDILAPLVLQTAYSLWEQISELSVPVDGIPYSYEDLCVRTSAGASNNATCVANPLLMALKTQPELKEHLKYPLTDNGWFIGHLIGGVIVDDNNRVLTAKALLLPYQLRYSTPALDAVAEKWELHLADVLSRYDSGVARIAWWTSETLPSEAARDRETLLKLLLPLFIVVTSFTVGCCFVGSWVRSRPWLGLGGVVSAALAILSSIGLLLLIGQPFTSVAFSMPFIIFSIGVDNVFILLAAWRKTPAYMRLHERMSLTFREAGVSITVTSLTDGVSFGVGCFTAFPSVSIFCMYSMVAVIFVYIYQLTFFAAIMVITGRRELANRHCITFRKIKAPTSYAAHNKSENWRTCKVSNGGYWSENGLAAIEQDHTHHHNHSLAHFFQTTYTDLLLNPFVRTFVLFGFLVYLGMAVWGCTQLKVGLEPTHLLPTDSYGRITLELQERYFTEYGSYLHVWVNLTNSQMMEHRGVDRRLWLALQREIRLYEHTEFTGYADSWLRVFLAFVNTAGLLLTPENFVYILREIFLVQTSYQRYTHDLLFDETGRELLAARFVVHLRNVAMTNQSRAMNLFRRLADTSQLEVSVYSDFFRFAEQYDAVLMGTLGNIGMAGAAVVVVSLLLIPRPLTAFWVSVTIASINVGIIGYMSFWGVHLDFVSMVTIVMSIGFCVDFSAHLAYHFSKEKSPISGDRLRCAMYAVGTPIIQSACSTILGVSFLIMVDSYVFRSFLKTVTLVIILGTYHGLIVLPVMLTLFSCDPEPQDMCSVDTGGITSNSSDTPESSERTRTENYEDSITTRADVYSVPSPAAIDWPSDSHSTMSKCMSVGYTHSVPGAYLMSNDNPGDMHSRTAPHPGRSTYEQQWTSQQQISSNNSRHLYPPGPPAGHFFNAPNYLNAPRELSIDARTIADAQVQGLARVNGHLPRFSGPGRGPGHMSPFTGPGRGPGRPAHANLNPRPVLR